MSSRGCFSCPMPPTLAVPQAAWLPHRVGTSGTGTVVRGQGRVWGADCLAWAWGWLLCRSSSETPSSVGDILEHLKALSTRCRFPSCIPEWKGHARSQENIFSLVYLPYSPSRVPPPPPHVLHHSQPRTQRCLLHTVTVTPCSGGRRSKRVSWEPFPSC